MSSTLTKIRLARSNDFDTICRLCSQNDEHHLDLRPDVFQPIIGPPRPRDFLSRLVDVDDAALIVAELNGNVVAFLSIRQASQPPYPMFQPRVHAFIDDLVVDADCRGRGIARMLLEEATRWTSKRGLISVQTNVWSTNDGAKKFYSKQGFRPYTERIELKLKDEKA